MTETFFWISLAITGLCTAYMGGMYWVDAREDRKLRDYYGLPRRR